MGEEDLPRSIGPLISPNYIPEDITKADVAISSTVWGLTLVWCGICSWQGLGQTKRARRPWKTVYIWMIWLELLVCFLMGLECWCFIIKWVHPSYAFYFTILFWWCIQVQLLLQIIINRVRVISLDKKRALAIMIATAVVVTLINISVYIHINEIWDRIEKGLYLLIDATLNVYFIKTVRQNLVKNGLQKYKSLLKFNTRIIFISILMDVMIITSMSIPNSFVYIQFHPLAYLIKLNIELTMAHLIRKIVTSVAAKRKNGTSAYYEFAYDISRVGTHAGIELGSSHCGTDSRLKFDGEGIQKTQEVVIRSELNPEINIISNSSTKDEQSSRTAPDDTDDESRLVHST
ncbi:hypothetical protein MPH_13816 [Macrophomina phaseolina MS6]|uniref:Transmembrane protein n=1 Tax=Macrophomina phaseolina (strain MS6) TaxID=1126212 RepID=K2R4R0_MACPH|nr:hypothetical protein MPH_13816 [Macrophomina phaseolina MS6]